MLIIFLVHKNYISKDHLIQAVIHYDYTIGKSFNVFDCSYLRSLQNLLGSEEIQLQRNGIKIVIPRSKQVLIQYTL